MNNLINKSILTAISFLFVIAFSPMTNAAENPFGMSNIDAQQTHVAGKDGKCGEGKCGGEKKAKCGEGKCGDSKKSSAKCGEGKCGDSKKSNAKCGEGKCGDSKKKKAKCGEGKCGG